MDIGSLFLILALLVPVLLFIARPFYERKATSVTPEEHERSALLAERDRVINALQEMDFDFKLGKIPEADYPVQRASLLQHGAEVLRKLDALQATAVPDPVDTPAAEPLSDAAIETAIADRRDAQVTTPAALAEDDELEHLIASRRREQQEKAIGFCPQCGKPVHRSDSFCPKCGKRLKPA